MNFILEASRTERIKQLHLNVGLTFEYLIVAQDKECAAPW